MASTTSKKSATAKKATATKKSTDVRVLENDGKPSGSGKGGVVKVHGVTTTGYQRGCRCDECKAAMTAYTQARREASKTDEQKAEEKKAAAAAKAKATREAKKANGESKPAAKGTTKRGPRKLAAVVDPKQDDDSTSEVA